METSVIKSFDELKDWLKAINQSIISFDCETTSLKQLELEMIGFSLCDGKRACYVDLAFEPEKLIALIGFYLEEVINTTVMHSAPFDLRVLYKYNIEPKKVICTQTLSHLINENWQSKSLKFLAHEVLGVPQSDIQKWSEAEKCGIQSPTFYEYATNDAIWTWQLYKKFAPQLKEQKLEHLAYDIEMPFQFVLRDLEMNGMLVDKVAAKEMLYRVRHLMYSIENEMLELWGGKYEVKCTPRSKKVTVEPTINFGSTDQLVPIIRDTLGLEIGLTKKKKPSIDKHVLKRLAGKHPFIDLLIKYRQVTQLHNMFLKPFSGFVDSDNRIRPSFHNTVAVTGRLSCSSPNLEQLPKETDIANFRNLFIAPDNHMLIVADYSGQELRVLGEESQDLVLKKAFADGEDLHSITAERMGISRNEAKTVNFGIAYGKGAYGLSKDFDISIEEGQRMLDKFFNTYPRVKTRIEQSRMQIWKHGYITNMSGRRRRFPNIRKLGKWGRERCFRVGFNFLIQGFSADVTKVAAANIIKDKNLRLVNLIHDEVVVECHKNYVEQGVKYIRKCMINAVKMSIPFEVDIKIGSHYGQCK